MEISTCVPFAFLCFFMGNKELKNYSRVSATGCAEIHNNMALSSLDPFALPVPVPAGFNLSLKLKNRHVWEGFFLYSILQEWSERNKTLIVSIHTPQESQLHAAIEERNRLIQEEGQEYVDHMCNLCHVQKGNCE